MVQLNGAVVSSVQGIQKVWSSLVRERDVVTSERTTKIQESVIRKRANSQSPEHSSYHLLSPCQPDQQQVWRMSVGPRRKLHRALQRKTKGAAPKHTVQNEEHDKKSFKFFLTLLEGRSAEDVTTVQLVKPTEATMFICYLLCMTYGSIKTPAYGIIMGLHYGTILKPKNLG